MIHLVPLCLSDVCLLVKSMFEKYNNKHNIREAVLCITSCRRAVGGILLYMMWIHNSNAAGEVMKCGPRAAEVLNDFQTYHPRREGTDGWNIPKMCGA